MNNFNIGDDGNRPDTISGLPAGLSFTVSQFVCITSPCNQNITLSGPPTASGIFPYTVKNANGDCSTSGTTGTITVSTSGSCSRNCIANYSTSYDASQNEFTLLLDDANNGVSYSWDFGDGTTSTLASPTHSYTKDSTYNVCLSVTTANNFNCSYCHVIGKDTSGNIYRAAGFNLNVLDPRSTTNIATTTDKENTVTVFPNPTKGNTELVFNAPVKDATIKVVSAAGETVIEKTTFSGTRFTIDLNNQPSGVYFVETNANGKTTHLKVVKQ